MFDRHPITMTRPCPKCGGRDGLVTTVGPQDPVRCKTCDTFVYNASKVETGREVRSTSTVHKGITSKKRARILERATCRCEMCGKKDCILHVGHLLSVEDGLKQGLTELELNSDENLSAMCDECNLGLGKNSLPLRLCIAILKSRAKAVA